MNSLAIRLITARLEAGLTQDELARAAGVKNQSTIGMLESGARKKTSYITALAEALKVSPIWLAEGRGPKRPADSSALPVEVAELLETITSASSKGQLTPEQARAFDTLIKTTTGSK